MYRIYGHRPQAFAVNFEKAIEQVVQEDLERIRRNVTAALARGAEQTLPPSEYRIVRPDGSQSVLLGRARGPDDADGKPGRMLGTVHDVPEGKPAGAQHRSAEMRRRSRLP